MCLNLKCHNSVSFLNFTSPKLSFFENNLLAIFKKVSMFSQTSGILKNGTIESSSLATYEFLESINSLLEMKRTANFLFLPCLRIYSSPFTPKMGTISKIYENRKSQLCELHLGGGGGIGGMSRGFPLSKLCIMLTLSLAMLCRKSRRLYSRARFKRCKGNLPARFRRRIKTELVRQKILKFYIASLFPSPDWYKNVQFCVGKQRRYKVTSTKKVKQKVRLIKAYSKHVNYVYLTACLFIILILCGDVHPNPGPVLQPHRRHPEAKALVAAAWNVRTLLEKGRSHVRPTAIVSRVLSKYNVDIAALSETRVLGENRIDEVEGGYTFFLKGKPLGEVRVHGVGIAIRTCLLPLLENKYPTGINERLMSVNLQLGSCSLTVIRAYAPTLLAKDDDKEEFYNNLGNLIKEVPPSNKLLLLGDFNARVGTDADSWDGVLGHHGVGAENSNGTMLLSLCTRNKLIITNTLFRQKEQFITTWMHPGSKKWHLLDYVITRQSDVKDVHHTRAMCGPCSWSDHKLVKCKMALKIPKPKHRARVKDGTKLNISKLQSEEYKITLSEKLTNTLTKETVCANAEATWAKHKDLTSKIAQAVLGPVKKSHKDWFDDNNDKIKPLLEELHDLRDQSIMDKDNSILASAYRSCKQKVQASLRAMQNNWWMQRAMDVQAAADRRDAKTLFQGLKAIFGPRKSSYPSVKSKDGKSVITDPDKILDRWVEHFDGVLNQPSDFDPTVLEEIPQWEINHSLADEPTLDEVEKSIKQLASGKAAGADGIPPDVYKHGGSSVRRHLLHLYQQCWNEGLVPQDFKDADLIHLYKNKGDSKVCDNHRGISLLSIGGKIFARILLNRLMNHILDIGLIPESQNGFMPGRSTIDPCFALRLLQEKCRLHGLDLYLLFIDLTKAFDTVSRPGLWALLTKIGCPEHFIGMVRSFHDGMKITVREGNKRADPFEVTNGTKQGCVLAPTLFSIFFSLMLLVAFKKTSKGIDIIHRFDRGLCQTNNVHFKARTKVTVTKIRELLYADDCALAALSQEDLQDLSDNFSSAANKFGLTISLKKTEVLHQPAYKGRYLNPDILINGKYVKSVNEFTYLGSIVNRDASMDPELSTRIAKANSAFNKLDERLWRKSGIRLDTKVMVYKAVVLSSLLYGSEAWTLSTKQIKRLEMFHQKCLRKICRIEWYHKIPDYEILERCQIGSLKSFLDRNKLRWTGHVIRMENTRIPKIMLYGRVDKGAAKRGNNSTYMNSLKALLRECDMDLSQLEEHAGNRNSWRSTINKSIKEVDSHRHFIMKENRRVKKARAGLDWVVV